MNNKLLKIAMIQNLFKKFERESAAHEDITPEELKTLIRLAKKVLWSDKSIRRKIQEQKVNIIPANFYSDIPLIGDVENSFEYRQPEGPYRSSRIFQPDKIRAFTEKLIDYAEEFCPPLEGNGENPAGFFWKNPAFSYADAMSYYCVIRAVKPQKMLEIGSGYSTLVADQAIRKNGSGSLIIIEPYPKNFLKKIETVEHRIEKCVQDVPAGKLISLLEECQLWFIDSTHTVKIGSDCLYIYLTIMPEIRNDLIVHTHDVMLPFAYPKKQPLDMHIYWTEQYLLYAYMLDNPKIEVLFGSMYVHTFMPELMKKLMGGKYPGGGGSFWYRLKGTEGLCESGQDDRVKEQQGLY